LFNENDLFLVSPANPDELARAIIRLKDDVDLCEKLILNAYEKYKNNCSPYVLGKKIINIINE
jgi:glycosyltransferase involved in cell wall biosynthesis